MQSDAALEDIFTSIFSQMDQTEPGRALGRKVSQGSPTNDVSISFLDGFCFAGGLTTLISIPQSPGSRKGRANVTRVAPPLFCDRSWTERRELKEKALCSHCVHIGGRGQVSMLRKAVHIPCALL